MAQHQNKDQPAGKTPNPGEAQKAQPKQHWPHADQWPSYTPQAETDNEFPEDPAACQPPSFTPQGRTDNEFPEEGDEDKPAAIPPPPGTNPQNPGRSGGTGQGRTDLGGEGRLLK